MTRAAVAIVLAAAASLPRTAGACATCISSGFGDRAYSWPYIGLILMPFLVAVGIVVTLAWHAGWHLRDVAGRMAAWRAEQWPRRHDEFSPDTNTETT